ncbi:helix-turn-helix domain-containing protein [Paraburkholderia sabiae]|uniref:Helix-turn-helix transcriptional regulator n=1 Tax=Paraburkholderia sabiae TaxID=273251 RepID=A0ABU9QI06_9BURK|nr:helix-turn-helix transcriptional regulator [Paraburkholderia sabiae]WJZ75929.1 helix-turn-helix transcriptional regulator [Paraburkholderia sabiae]CAD6554507.1 hypothetical protein LMG24235_05452 [Paraburkholderia sabiae]
MDYSVKTLGQLRPVLRGFRKAAGLTQAMLAERLGITQQSYAQFEANPAAAGVERLFTVLRLLNAGITLSQDEPTNAAPAAKIAPSNRATAPAANARKASAIKTTRRAQPVAAAKSTRRSAPKTDGRAATARKRAASAPRKREQW